MPRQIFVNLPVKDLEKTKAFFAALGFTYNAQFTNNDAACMVISDTIYAMLLTEPFFARFTKKQIVDAKQATEVLVALSAESREAVDDMAEKAVAAGGTMSREPEDYGWMYSKSFEDLDGHVWEIVWMDPNHIQK